MKLPKLYRIVTIEFWSLRNSVGSSLGMIFDIDTLVQRKARRVRFDGGWKWQIKDLQELFEWDYFAETDQEFLDDWANDESDDIKVIY